MAVRSQSVSEGLLRHSQIERDKQRRHGYYSDTDSHKAIVRPTRRSDTGDKTFRNSQKTIDENESVRSSSSISAYLTCTDIDASTIRDSYTFPTPIQQQMLAIVQENGKQLQYLSMQMNLIASQNNNAMLGAQTNNVEDLKDVVREQNKKISTLERYVRSQSVKIALLEKDQKGETFV